MIRIVFSFFCLLSAGAAHADIYGYIDAQGVIHFADHPVDQRYSLFFKTGQTFDSARLATRRATGPAVPGSTAAASDEAAERERPAAASPVANGLPPPAPLSAVHSRFFERVSDHPNVVKYAPLIQQVAGESGVDIHLIQSVIAVESGYNPTAVSPKGAVGLMQIMPGTGERYGVRADAKRSVEQKLTDPAINLRIGARYLADLRKMFEEDLSLVLAAYNAGENAVKRYRNKIPPFPETQAYVKLVAQFYEFYKPAPVAAVPYRPARSAEAIAQEKADEALANTPITRVRMVIGGRRNMPDMGRLPPADVLRLPSSLPSSASAPAPSPSDVADGAPVLQPSAPLQ